MKKILNLKMVLVASFLVAPLFSFGQFKFLVRPFFSYFKDKSRWEIGANYIQSNGNFEGVVPFYGFNNFYTHDETIKRDIKADNGYGGFFGVQVPVAATGHISVWAISIRGMFNYMNWSDLNKAYNLDGTFKDMPNQMSMTTKQFAVPIGIDWKIGSDAIASRRLKMGLDLGAGIYPHMNVSSIDTAHVSFPPQSNFGLYPYFNADLSFFAKVCFKVRAMYTWGNCELINSSNTTYNYGLAPFTDGPFKVTSHNHLMVSLVIMPFSYKWREFNWATDYDTYNWNEKIN